ncbi:hypothetical protein [Candidatus Chlamydia corallus]|uniref:hypothetical protein n=1 Tax=Candidatus Chlamydia corallus TaxID=2038470 RepID=UPI001EFE38F4|nr:hypothetical protein [Candidatus Chlamydia corallus]
MNTPSLQVTITDDPVLNTSNSYGFSIKGSLKPIAYLLLAILAIGSVMAALYFCSVISGGTLLLAMLITLSICSVLCVIYLFYRQSSIEKTTVFSIASPSVFFSDQTLNLLLGGEDPEVTINEFLKNFALDDFRRPKILPPSNFLEERGNPDDRRETRIKYLETLLKNVIAKMEELQKTPPDKLKLLWKFANKDLANSSVAVLYEGLMSALQSSGEELLEMLFSLEPTWIKNTLGLNEYRKVEKTLSSVGGLMQYFSTCPDIRATGRLQAESNRELCALNMQTINLRLSALCLRSSHDRIKACEIIQKYCPHFSAQEIKDFIEQKNILAPLLNHIFQGEEETWLGLMSLDLKGIAPSSIYPEPDPTCWKAVNSIHYAKNSEDQQEDFNKTKEAYKAVLKKLVIPELSVTSIPKLLKIKSLKQGLDDLGIMKEQILENPFIFLEALIESEECFLSIAKYLKLLMPISLWDKFFYILYSGQFQVGLVCQGEINTFCKRTKLNPEALLAAVQQGKLLSFLFPKMLLD